MFRQIKKRKSLFSGFTPITIRRIENFKANKRGYFSLWIFLFVLFSTLFAEFIANDKPLLVKYKGELFFPVLISYPETDFDGEFDAIATAFGTSGHTHDGTSENGGAVTKIGPAQDLVVSASLVTIGPTLVTFLSTTPASSNRSPNLPRNSSSTI